jgi:hypothetical protein
MKKAKFLSFVYTFLLFNCLSFAQGVVTGSIQDANSAELLTGANVVDESGKYGTSTNFDGSFSISLPAGKHTLSFSFIGYNETTKVVTVKNGAIKDLGSISLAANAIGLEEINLISSIAVDRKTPVAVTTISPKVIEEQLGSLELPEILRSTPGVYATKQGGGIGDSRVNIRGFDQTNVAVLINGVPVNDMENGRVYWSNWAGLGDATRSMQVQRGLGASKLAINSVGGTINIITKTTEAKKGGSLQQSLTDFGTSKTVLSLSTGLMDNGYAVSFVGSRTEGSGYIDGTFVDAWSYFLSVAKDINKDHKLVFTAIGAPQMHGQRDQMITAEEHTKYGNKYNKDWGWRNGEMINQRVNKYHKPQIALNHYWTVGEKTTLSTSAYISKGTGYGSGPLGDYTNQDALGQINWDEVVTNNSTHVDTLYQHDYQGGGIYGDTIGGGYSKSILRNSVNNHFWVGLLSTLNHEINPNLNLIAGIDARKYKGEHYREVRDLMGGDFWFENYKYAVDGIGGRNQEMLIGDKIAYDNDGLVNYGGAFGQLEYTKGNLSAFAAGSASNTSFQRVDRYNYIGEDNGGASQESEVVNILGYNAKMGANYNLNETSNLFFNTGYYSKAPFFDGVFVNYQNVQADNILNERVAAVEGGYGYTASKVNVRANMYYTKWMDKSFLKTINVDGVRTKASIRGLDALHKGFELELNAKPTKDITLSLMASLGDWTWDSNVEAIITDDNTLDTLAVAEIFPAGMKVGNAPQTQLGGGLNYKFSPQIDVSANYVYFDQLYTNFDPSDMEVELDDAGIDAANEANLLNSYGLLDLHLNYRFKVGAQNARASVNCYNVLDADYMAEGISQDTGFWGYGRNFNFSLKLDF